jgi:hypothetical protein
MLCWAPVRAQIGDSEYTTRVVSQGGRAPTSYWLCMSVPSRVIFENSHVKLSGCKQERATEAQSMRGRMGRDGDGATVSRNTCHFPTKYKIQFRSVISIPFSSVHRFLVNASQSYWLGKGFISLWYLPIVGKKKIDDRLPHRDEWYMINNCAAHLKPMHLEKKSLTVMSRGTEIKNPHRFRWCESERSWGGLSFTIFGLVGIVCYSDRKIRVMSDVIHSSRSRS